MKVYIAGPINGFPNGNRESFLNAAALLLDLGHDPVNPHEVSVEHDGACLGDEVQHSSHRYGCFMLPDIKALLDCEGYTLLPGWQRSRGARVEHDVAEICGKHYVPLYKVQQLAKPDIYPSSPFTINMSPPPPATVVIPVVDPRQRY